MSMHSIFQSVLENRILTPPKSLNPRLDFWKHSRNWFRIRIQRSSSLRSICPKSKRLERHKKRRGRTKTNGF